MARRLIQACRDTNMTQPAIMFVDGADDEYVSIPLSANWSRVMNYRITGVGPAMNWFFESHPDLPFYGWLADDFIPKTPGWDVALSKAAGDRYISFCQDEWPGRQQRILSHITSAFAIGGDLVRAVGWFAAPGLRQAGIDSAWNTIGRQFRLFRYLPEVVVEHVHWKNRKRSVDAVDNTTPDSPQATAEHPAWRRYRDGRDSEAAHLAVRKFLER